MKKQIIINLEENNNIQLKIEGEITFPIMVTAVFTTLEAFAAELIKDAKAQPNITPAQVNSIRNDIFDEINQVATVCLNRIQPDAEMNPDLDIHQQIEDENKSINEQHRKFKQQRLKQARKDKASHHNPKNSN